MIKALNVGSRLENCLLVNVLCFLIRFGKRRNQPDNPHSVSSIERGEGGEIAGF